MSEPPDRAGDSVDGSGGTVGPSVDPSAPGQPIKVAAGLVLVEALMLVGLAIAELVKLDPDQPTGYVGQAIFFLLYAAGLAACARGLVRSSAWSRGPIVLAQLIELGVAWSFRGGDTTWVAVLLAIPAIVVLVVMLSPSTTQALYATRLNDDAG